MFTVGTDRFAAASIWIRYRLTCQRSNVIKCCHFYYPPQILFNCFWIIKKIIHGLTSLLPSEYTTKFLICGNFHLVTKIPVWCKKHCKWTKKKLLTDDREPEPLCSCCEWVSHRNSASFSASIPLHINPGAILLTASNSNLVPLSRKQFSYKLVIVFKEYFYPRKTFLTSQKMVHFSVSTFL